MFFIDIAVPRDVDPAMNKLDGIFVYDIDDLQQAVASHVADRRKEAERAEAIVTIEVERFQARMQTLDVVPTIVSLQDHLETIRQAEIDRVRGRLGQMTPDQEMAVEAMTRGIVNKIMHTPISTLKTAAREPEATTVIDLVRRLFNLQEKRGGRGGPSGEGRALMARLRIGSRGSQLALWQANHISALLRARGHEVELEIIKTTGDKILDVAIAKVGTKGMFTKEIEEALADGRVDLAVHSLKDLPTELAGGFRNCGHHRAREPARCFLFAAGAALDLPQRARVGTSSLRRQAQLKAMRPDIEIHSLRGNVDTRLRKLAEGEYDAIILAAAGLNRLGKTDLVKQMIPEEIMCPAAGQGALGIEIRKGDTATRQHLAFLDDADARAATTCERALLNKLGAVARFRSGPRPRCGYWMTTSDPQRLKPSSSVARQRQRPKSCPSRIHLESIVAYRRFENCCAIRAMGTIRKSSATMRAPRCSPGAGMRFSRLSMGARVGRGAATVSPHHDLQYPAETSGRF